MNQRIPCSTAPINGELRIQRKTVSNSPWEFCVGRKNEINKLPSYPITHGVCKPGIQVTLKLKSGPEVAAAFHGYAKGFYIGSARKLLGNKQTASSRNFLKTFGVNIGIATHKIPVKLDFRDGNIVCIS
jgi:hypothetical protein